MLIVLMYWDPSCSLTFSLVRGGMTLLVKYLNAGLGEWMASRKTLETKNTWHRWGELRRISEFLGQRNIKQYCWMIIIDVINYYKIKTAK